MSNALLLELIGYVASILVAVSLMMRSILRLRLINLVGSLAFTAYGLLIGAYPVAAVNALIVGINLYYLRGMRRTTEFFRLLEVKPDSEYLRYFLDHYASEIQRFLPGQRVAPTAEHMTLFVLRDLVPAGVFIARREGPHALCVVLDFVTPPYRDFKTGRYLYVEQAGFFRARGITEILSPPGSPEHAAYLRRMGFAPLDPGDEHGLLRLTL
ncbi:MAG TPA: hypothetical protein VD948_13415 [Rhodothermales bacterium]|nr:hypothetical protein [Rhodothermales bacterium]